LFIYLRIFLHDIFVLNSLLQNVETFLYKMIIGRTLALFTIDSLNNWLNDVNKLFI
jgi:hypothetical protein